VSEKTILLVEDDRDQVTLAMRAPRKHGIVEEVVVAGDGAEALDYLFGEGSYADRDTTTMPEFVLLDVHLPKMDGLQVLERLREDERTELVPVILFSSSREDLVEVTVRREQLRVQARELRQVLRGHAVPRLVLAQPQRVAREVDLSGLPRT